MEVILHVSFHHRNIQNEKRNTCLLHKDFRAIAQTRTKVFADMLYGTLASESCLLSETSQELNESTKKINTVDRLSRHLAKGIPQEAEASYLRLIQRMVPSNPVVYFDDSDIMKPDGHHFEALGVVRDGSASSKRSSTKRLSCYGSLYDDQQQSVCFPESTHQMKNALPSLTILLLLP